MKHFKGWWLQQLIIFSCSTWWWVLSQHTNRVAKHWLQEHGEQLISLCFPQGSHTLNWHCPFLCEKISSSSSGAEHTVWIVSGSAHLLWEEWFFWATDCWALCISEGNLTRRSTRQSQLCSSHLLKEKIMCGISKEYRRKHCLMFSYIVLNWIFAYITFSLIINHLAAPTAQDPLRISFLPAGFLGRQLDPTVLTIRPLPPHKFWTW